MTKRLLSDEERFELLKRHHWDPHDAAREARVHHRTAYSWADELRKKGYDVGYKSSIYGGNQPPAEAVAETRQAGPPPAQAVQAILKKGPAALQSIADQLKISRGHALDAIDELRGQGLNVHEHSGMWVWSKQPTPGHAREDLPVLTTDADGWLRFGVTSDNHLCSKYARLDVLNDLYDKFAEAGLSIVLNAGNWIDGEAPFNRHDLLVHGLNQQLEYLVANFPARPGITTFAIAGDDHEGWYAQRAGVDIGRMAQQKMRDHGRADWVDVGYMEAFLRMAHAGTGAHSMLHLMHPGGGSAYAESYTVQKIVEGYDGGEKPAILVAGHYHKSSYNRIRNVCCLQPGCTQDQTPFARKKKIRFSLAGWIVNAKIDAETGAVERIRLEEFGYFVRGYYNNRWNHAGAVEHAERGAAA